MAAPAPGELGIKERRAWKTWQLLVTTGFALVLGMFLGYGNGSSTSANQGSQKSGHALPPPSASGTGSSGATATTVPATTTTVAGSTGSTAPPTAAGSGTATILVPRFQSQGNWTSPTFTIASGTWNIGWAFQCTPAPASGPGLQVFVVDPGAAPSGTAAVSETVASGQGVTPLTTTGAQQIVVQAPTGCIWVVKVTGIGS